MLAIEIIEGCNFKCYFCNAKDLKSPIFMDLELFKDIVLQAKKLGITKLNLTPCKGEPFMHPEIYEILDFSSKHMKETFLFTNGTAINVNKLKKINLSNIKLCISFYGNTLNEFLTLTQTNEKLYTIFHNRLKQLKERGIPYEIHHRGLDYQFDYPGNLNNPVGKKQLDKKCKYHHEPKIFVNGDVTFCIFAREQMPNNKEIFFANVKNKPLKDILEHPLRFKFYDSQSLCISSECISHEKNCYVNHSLASIKLLFKSKKNYLFDKEVTDQEYKKIEESQ